MNRHGVAAIVFFGVFGVWTWVIVFAAGILLDSRPYREALGAASPLQASGEAPPQSALAPVTALAGGLPDVAVASPPPPATLAGHLFSFAAAVLLFTPLNAAILALLAALIGGCASWLAHKDDTIPDSATPEERARLERHMRFWNENPLSAMLRGFVVYLTVIAGVYVTGSDPFANASPDQYVRFAGTVSLLAFVLGYDPTRLQDLIEGVPRPGKKA